jgi:GntR family transcriptional regulator
VTICYVVQRVLEIGHPLAAYIEVDESNSQAARGTVALITVNTRRISQFFNEANLNYPPSMPKYLKLCEVIQTLINNREYHPGDKLPTESDLSAALPVSIGTIQKALATLTDRGVLTRTQGSGTFVANKSSELSDLWHFRFIDDVSQKILPVFTKVIAIDRVRNYGPWTVFLGEDTHYVRITRELDVNQEFNVIGQFFLRGSDFDALMNDDLIQFEGVHLRCIIQQRWGISTQKVTERVVAETFPEAICRWLRIPYYSMGLVAQILAYTYKDKPLSFQQLFVPPNARPLEIREHQPR